MIGRPQQLETAAYCFTYIDQGAGDDPVAVVERQWGGKARGACAEGLANRIGSGRKQSVALPLARLPRKSSQNLPYVISGRE